MINSSMKGLLSSNMLLQKHRVPFKAWKNLMQWIHVKSWIKTHKKKNQCRAIQREFELVGPTLLKNPLDTKWGLLPTLRWEGGFLFISQTHT
jgi:hypothetical protein